MGFAKRVWLPRRYASGVPEAQPSRFNRPTGSRRLIWTSLPPAGGACPAAHVLAWDASAPLSRSGTAHDVDVLTQA